MLKFKPWFWAAIGAALVASRLAHINILWSDEDYHLAAAIQVLQGKMLYRDLWYDKPPLTALLLTLFGAWPGWPLRIASAALACAGSAVAYRFAAAVWGQREGFLAAALLAFFQIFYFPNAVLTLEPDTLLIFPHLLAVYWAWRGRPIAAGITAGIAFLLHPKAAFILLSCLIFAPGSWVPLSAAFLLPNILAVLWLVTQGAWSDYVTQVWTWGLRYTASPSGSASEGLARLAGWSGFHAALLIGLVLQWRTTKSGRGPWIAWCGLALVAASLGWRFAPRYLNILLPPLVLTAAAGLARLRSPVVLGAVGIALAVPALRFGPRYFSLAAEDFAGVPHAWTDVRMDQESRAGAAAIRAIQRPGDTLFIWGYRPNVVVYTRLPVAGRLWDSQPLTGVPADRHLESSNPVMEPEWTAQRRHELILTSPSILVDGLSAYNPKLAIQNFPDLADWFARYCPATASPPGLRIYRRCGGIP